MHRFAKLRALATRRAPACLCRLRPACLATGHGGACRLKRPKDKLLHGRLGRAHPTHRLGKGRRRRHTRCSWRSSMKGTVQAVRAIRWKLPIDRPGEVCYDSAASSAFPLPCTYYKRSVVPYRVTGPVGPLSAYRRFQGNGNPVRGLKAEWNRDNTRTRCSRRIGSPKATGPQRLTFTERECT